MCTVCGNVFCNGACSQRNIPNWNPPFSQPFVSPFSKVCFPSVPGYLPGTYPGNFPGPFPNRCGCAKPECYSCNNNGCLFPTTSDCVTIACPMNCMGIPEGTSLSTVLQALDAANCCGNWINMQLVSGCTAASIGLPLAASGNTYPLNFTSPAQYLIDGCGNVSLRGFVQMGPTIISDVIEFTSTLDPHFSLSQIITILPVGIRPKSLFVTSVFGQVGLGNPVEWSTFNAELINMYLFITPDGIVFLGATMIGTAGGDPPEIYNFQLSMDNIRFSTK